MPNNYYRNSKSWAHRPEQRRNDDAALYVENVSLLTTWQALKDHMKGGGGSVEIVEMAYEKSTNFPLGSAIVTFRHASEVEAAIKALSGSVLQGKTLRLRKEVPHPRPACMFGNYTNDMLENAGLNPSDRKVPPKAKGSGEEGGTKAAAAATAATDARTAKKKEGQRNAATVGNSNKQKKGDPPPKKGQAVTTQKNGGGTSSSSSSAADRKREKRKQRKKDARERKRQQRRLAGGGDGGATKSNGDAGSSKGDDGSGDDTTDNETEEDDEEDVAALLATATEMMVRKQRQRVEQEQRQQHRRGGGGGPRQQQDFRSLVNALDPSLAHRHNERTGKLMHDGGDFNRRNMDTFGEDLEDVGPGTREDAIGKFSRDPTEAAAGLNLPQWKAGNESWQPQNNHHHHDRDHHPRDHHHRREEDRRGGRGGGRPSSRSPGAKGRSGGSSGHSHTASDASHRERKGGDERGGGGRNNNREKERSDGGRGGGTGGNGPQQQRQNSSSSSTRQQQPLPSHSRDHHHHHSRSAKIFVSNLPYSCSRNMLRDTFSQIGTVVRAEIHVDHHGRSRGVGTVVFASADDAETAVEEFDQVPMEGRPMAVRIDKE